MLNSMYAITQYIKQLLARFLKFRYDIQNMTTLQKSCLYLQRWIMKKKEKEYDG